MINFSWSKLADYLNWIEEIKDIVAGGVWFGKLVKDKDYDPMIVLRIASDEPNTDYENIARVQMILYIPRSSPASLYETVFNKVNKYLISKENSDRVRSIDWFNIRNIESWTTFGPDYDLQDNVIISKDYLFYYSSRQWLLHQLS